jgi:hypothetical protein
LACRTLLQSLDHGLPNQLVWRGTATKTLNPGKDPGKNYKNLQKAMEKLFKNFSPSTELLSGICYVQSVR